MGSVRGARMRTCMRMRMCCVGAAAGEGTCMQVGGRVGEGGGLEVQRRLGIYNGREGLQRQGADFGERGGSAVLLLFLMGAGVVAGAWGCRGCQSG